METKANYVAVGAFVLACMVGLVVTVLWLANSGSADYALLHTGGNPAAFMPSRSSRCIYSE